MLRVFLYSIFLIASISQAFAQSNTNPVPLPPQDYDVNNYQENKDENNNEPDIFESTGSSTDSSNDVALPPQSNTETPNKQISNSTQSVVVDNQFQQVPNVVVQTQSGCFVFFDGFNFYVCEMPIQQLIQIQTNQFMQTQQVQQIQESQQSSQTPADYQGQNATLDDYINSAYSNQHFKQ